MRVYRLHLGEAALVFDAFFATRGTGRAPARSAAARPMIVSGAAPPMVDALRRVRRCQALPVSTRLLPFLPRALASADGLRPLP